MIADYLGLNFKDRIYEYLPTLSPSGTSQLHLPDMARSLSLDAKAYRVDSDHLADLQCPFIARLNDDHYFVVCSVNENSILVADPATSLHSISHESLISRWSGYVLHFQIAAAGK